MSEIRWILLGLGLILIAGIWWWGARRSAQAPAGADLGRRETMPSPPPVVATPSRPPAAEWGISPLEPLAISTTDFDDVPVLDLPLRVERPEPVRAEPMKPSPPPVREPAERARAAVAQKIVTLRVGAQGGHRWSGTELRAALEQEGLQHGRYQVFHRLHADGSTLFCVANLVEPGAFDLDAMGSQDFRGVSAFAVFPGAQATMQTFESLLDCVRGLSTRLGGAVQDVDGSTLTPQRVAVLREELARFHAQHG